MLSDPAILSSDADSADVAAGADWVGNTSAAAKMTTSNPATKKILNAVFLDMLTSFLGEFRIRFGK
jgi:hypothetical protein